MDLPYPDEFTLDEMVQALRHSPAWVAITGVSKTPDKLRVRFCWRKLDDIRRCPGDMTLAVYRKPPEGWEPAIIIDEGGGGLGVAAPSPELVG